MTHSALSPRGSLARSRLGRSQGSAGPVRAHPEGFTLIELLAAIVLFSIGTLSLVSVLPLGTSRVTRAANQTRASQLASACAERLLTTPYGDPALAMGTHEDPENPHDAIYYLRWAVEDDLPAIDCKRVTVDARWPSADSAPGASLVIVVPRSGG